MNDQTGAWLPVKDAAPRFGLTLDQLRRRLRRGEVRGRRVPTPTGHSWLVWIGIETDVSDIGHQVSGDGRPLADGGHAATDGGRRPSDTAPPPAATEGLATVRAQEMAAYSERLLAPYVRRIEEQAERIGHLEERCATLQARLADATSANGRTHESAAPEWERRSWWQRLVWG